MTAKSFTLTSVKILLTISGMSLFFFVQCTIRIRNKNELKSNIIIINIKQNFCIVNLLTLTKTLEEYEVRFK